MRKKQSVADLLKSKKRSKKRKGKRLAHERARVQVRRVLLSNRRDANIVVVKNRNAAGETEEVVFGCRVGLLGHPTTTVLRVETEKVVGAVENQQELGEIVTQLGLLTLGALLNFNLALGPEELAKALAKWVGIDLEALKKAAEADAEAAPSPVDEVPGEQLLQASEDVAAVPALDEVAPESPTHGPVL